MKDKAREQKRRAIRLKLSRYLERWFREMQVGTEKVWQRFEEAVQKKA